MLKKEKCGKKTKNKFLFEFHLTKLLLVFPIQSKANEKGHLFAGLHQTDLVKVLHSELHIELLPENPDFKTIIVQPGEPFEIEGLAVGLIRNTMLM